MSQGLFDKDIDEDSKQGSDDDGDDGDETAVMLPSGGNKQRKTAKEKRRATERKVEVSERCYHEHCRMSLDTLVFSNAGSLGLIELSYMHE